MKFKEEGITKGKSDIDLRNKRETCLEEPGKGEALSDTALENAAGGQRMLRTEVPLNYECSLWRCREHWSNGTIMKDRYGFSKCPMCGGLATCKTCYYSRQQGSLLLCANPKK